jgi:hypothetical protein
MLAPVIDLALRPSRLFGHGLIALYFMTCLILLFTDLHWMIQAPVFALVALLGFRAWHYWRGLTRWRRLIIKGEGIGLVGNDEECDLSPGSQMLSTSWLVILPFRSAAGKILVPLLPDSLSQADWRRLRVWLRCRPGFREVRH